MEFKTILKQLRLYHNLTQNELSNILNIKQSTYSHYETGKRQPDISTLIRIADFFHCSIDYLVGRYKNS